MSNVREIAETAGVSITTVSRVLNNHPRVSSESRSKVLTAVNQSGYIAKMGRRSVSNIAFFYTGESSLGSPFDGAVMHGISSGLDERGLDLMVLSAHRSRRKGETFTQMFQRKGVRGAILRSTSTSRDVCRTIADEGFPAVVIGDRFDEGHISHVDADSRNSVREAIEHLIALGHRQIAMCTNIVDDTDHADRIDAFRTVLRDRGLPFDERSVLRTPANREGGLQVVRRLASMPSRPTAVFMADPQVAVAAVGAAPSVGLSVPDHLSVIGFDDAETRFGIVPTMTSVCQEASLLGSEAFAVLMELMEPGSAGLGIKRSMQTWFEIHGTTGPAPQRSRAEP